jgi:ABC-2 type transport system ATP-binding protein
VDVNVVGTQVRIEKDQAHRFVTNVVEAFPGEIDAVSIAKPSLEDVFIKRTGHRFWTEASPATEGATKSKARKH